MVDALIVVPDGLALMACVVAVATDLRSRRIPNQVTVAALLIGLVLNLMLGGLPWLLSALAGAALGLLVFGLPAAFGMVGMGDVKLVVALGALLRWPVALPLALYIALAGGVIALLYAVRRRCLGAVAQNVISARTAAQHRMPYALAIAIGCALAVASRHIAAS